jgi:hypothetical protein
MVEYADRNVRGNSEDGSQNKTSPRNPPAPEKNPLLQKSPISLVKPTNSEPVSNRHGTYNAGSTSTVEHQCLCLLETKLVSWVTPFFACIGLLASAMANPNDFLITS